MPVSSQVSVVPGATHGNRAVLMRARASEFLIHPGPPGTTYDGFVRQGGSKALDVLHERCAGLDISKKDAKACVRTPSTKQPGVLHNPDHNVGIDDERSPRPAGPPARHTGDAGCDPGDLGLPEAPSTTCWTRA